MTPADDSAPDADVPKQPWDAGVDWDSLSNPDKLRKWWQLRGQRHGLPRNADGEPNRRRLAKEAHIKRRQVFYQDEGNPECVALLAEYDAFDRARLTSLSPFPSGQEAVTQGDAHGGAFNVESVSNEGIRKLLDEKDRHINRLEKLVARQEGEIEGLKETVANLQSEIAYYHEMEFAEELLETGRTDLPDCV